MFLLKEFMMAVSNDNFIYSLYLTSCEINNQSRGAMVYNAAYCRDTMSTHLHTTPNRNTQPIFNAGNGQIPKYHMSRIHIYMWTNILWKNSNIFHKYLICIAFCEQCTMHFPSKIPTISMNRLWGTSDMSMHNKRHQKSCIFHIFG